MSKHYKNKKYTLLFMGYAVLLSLARITVYADDTMTLYNHTDMPVFAALYYVKSTVIGKSVGPAERPGGIIEVPPYKEKKLVRPPWKVLTDNREIIFSTNKETLKKNLNVEEYKLSSNKSAGQKFGSIYHIIKEHGIIAMCGDAEYKLLKPIENLAQDVIDRIFHESTDYFKQHPYAKTEASIRQSYDLCPDEIQCVAQRSIKAKKALENLLKTTLKDTAIPRIGICMSGGGVRAAICSYGLLAGLDEIGVLDASTYAAGLSGSTWLLSSFLEVGKPIAQYRKEFLQAVTKEHLLDTSAITDTFLQKYVYKQPLNIVDLYGAYLSNKFFRNLSTDLDRQRVWFSSLRNRVNDGSFMFPLCTAIDISKSENNPTWFTFSPYEVGSDELGLHLPIWALGRKFVNGKTPKENNPPELRLGFLMGIWGSALSGTFKQGYNSEIKKSINNPLVRSIFENILDQTVGSLQAAPINLPNPFYGINKSDYQDLEQLTLLDAGLALLMPFPPLLNKIRGIDIIIALDASQSVHQNGGGNELRKAEQYARSIRAPFPKIDYTNITKKAVHVFVDSNPKTPIVIYIPPVKNTKHAELGDPETDFPKIYKTANFSYSNADTERLIDIIRYNIIDNKELIIDAIKQKINQKNNSRN